VAWVLYISVSALERGEPSSLADNIYWFSFSSLNWFFSSSALSDHPFRTTVGLWGIWLLAIACVFIILTLRRRYAQITSTEIPVLLFGLTYTLILIGIATLSSFNRLDGRFVAPLYIPFILLLMVSSDTVMNASKNNMFRNASAIVVWSVLLILCGFSVARSMEAINVQRGESWGYTSKEWYENQALGYWLQHQPKEDALAFSNYPAGVAIYSWNETLASPRKVYPLEEYAGALFEDGKSSYLVWIEPNTYTHVYNVEELMQIAVVETLYEGKDGGVYRLLPLQ
jgi:hypothetical protein